MKTPSQFLELLLLYGIASGALVPTNLRVERVEPRDAVGIDTPNPLFSWAYESDGLRGESLSASMTLTVAHSEPHLDISPLWQSSIRNATSIRYAGTMLRSSSRLLWRVCNDETGACSTSSFVTGVLSKADWHGAQWISGRQLRSPQLDLPDGGVSVRSAVVSVTGLGFYELELNGARIGDAKLDPGFSTNITERLLYATYDLTDLLRGTDSGDGSVVLGARVGAGKYSYSVNPYAVPGQNVFAFLCTLVVHVEGNDTPITLSSNSSWLESESPIVWENLYEGEHYDARLAQENWSSVEFDPHTAPQPWRPAQIISPPGIDRAILSARTFPPIRITRAIKPTNATMLANGSFFFDVGNNFAGVAQVSLPIGMDSGSVMTIVCTEYADIALVPFGPPDIYKQKDVYVFSGSERQGQTWAPTFVYHGYRYIRVDFSDADAAARGGFSADNFRSMVYGLFMHSDVKKHGALSFDGSSATAEAAVLARIHDMIVQTQLDNLHSIPTDCPQREKRGWMGDAQWTAEQAIMTFDMGAFYSNWVRTMHDVQNTGCTVPSPDSHGNVNMSGYCWVYPPGSVAGRLQSCNLTNSYCCVPSPPGANPLHPSISYCSPQYNQSDTAGSIPDIVPNSWGRGGSRGWPGAPTWSSAYVQIPGALLQYDGDIALATAQYEGIANHVAFLARQARYGRGVPAFGMLGDWCSIEPFCPGSSDGCLQMPGWIQGDATSSFYYIKNLEVMVQLANVTGRPGDSARFAEALSAARSAYFEAYFNITTQDFGPTQTGNVLGILAAPKVMPGAVSRLVANIHAQGTHVVTGAVGARWMLQALTAANRTDLALTLASTTSAPSWGWFLDNGPGTLHENWPTGPTPSGTTAGSLNHIMFGGGIGVWLYHEIGGLRPSPGVEFKLQFGVEPIVLRRVVAAAATSSMRGHKVRSSWRYNATSRNVAYNCTVPPTATASLTLPWREPAVLRESGAHVWPKRQGIAMVTGVRSIQVDTTLGTVSIALEHGSFLFDVSLGAGL